MESKIILLTCIVIYIAVVTECGLFDQPPRILKACDDSEREIDDVSEVRVGNVNSEMFELTDVDGYFLEFIFKTPNDTAIEDENSIIELKCNSSEIKGSGEVAYVVKKQVLQQTAKLDRDTVYTLYFKGRFDKAPTEGDICDIRIIVNLNDEKNSYCIADNAKIVKPYKS